MLLLSLCVHGKAWASEMIIKISVLSSGSVLLDGKPTEIADLKRLLESTKGKDAVVWYYRESADAEAPPQAMEVIKLIAKNRLSISFSTKPDFSDYVDSKGVSHPRTPAEWDRKTFDARMPDLAAVADIEQLFIEARKRAAGTPPALIVVRPDRTLGIMPTPDHPPQSAVAGISHFVSPAVRRNIAVIAYTGFSQETFASTSAADANKAIPLFGLLVGLAHIGHSVWIFEGHSSAIAAGCRNADLLIVDSAMLPFLENGWDDKAAKVMRNANILVHDRATFKLHIVRKVGADNNLQFHD
jgi:hypothetical protein